MELKFIKIFNIFLEILIILMALDRNFPIELDCSVFIAKKLLKKFGGNACTQHFDRDGGLFETTSILLRGNNSKFKYNRHL